ncbi:MAG: DUF192 domain-containing protein [Alphaproteobacteria bacterium]
MALRYAGIVLTVLALGAAASFLTAEENGAVSFARDRLVVQTAAGADHAFEVEVATTPEQRARGLMFRDDLGSGAGMLFVFEGVREVSFWMKDTRIPLDLLFIDAGGTIVRIAAEATPYSLAPIPSRAPVKAVLEIAGGRAAELGIAVGDRVRHPTFRGDS